MNYTTPKGPGSIHGWSTTAQARSIAPRLRFSAALLLVALAGLAHSCESRADLITEFGGGFAVPAWTSPLAQPSCWAVVPQRNLGSGQIAPANGDPGELWACGGHDPLFVGWPIAWEFPNGVRLGLFHVSHWFDGPPFHGDGELQITCLCASYTIHWGRMWQRH